MFDRVWVCCMFLVQRFDAVIEALEKGQAVDLSGLPPSPGQGEEHWYYVKEVCNTQPSQLHLYSSFKNRSSKVTYRRNTS